MCPCRKRNCSNSIIKACGFVGISRLAYYLRAASEASKIQQQQALVALIKAQSMVLPRVVTRKLYHLLQDQFAEHHIKIGRDSLFDLLRQARLLVLPKCPYHNTTYSHHRFYKHHNPLKPGDT